jgi:archaellum component FlaC
MVRHYGDTVYVQMVKDEDGTYVQYSDCAEIVGKMQAALAREQKRLGEAISKLSTDAEVTRLKAEVERLSKPAIIGGYNLSQYIRMANSETLEFDNGDMFADMTLPERIKYIVESHARLKAEVERLTELNATISLRYDATKSMLDGCAKDIEEMEAEIERLKGGQP